MAITTTKRSRDRARRRSSLSLASTTALATLLLAPCANAAEWRVVPKLDLRETYTDNVRLAPSGAEHSDFITDISPGISILGNGPGLKLKANYAYQYLSYLHDDIGSSHFHKLDAEANAELIKNLFFIDGRAAINQQSAFLTGPQATSNYQITDNRTTVKTFTISPYLRHNFGSTAVAEARYMHSTVSTDTDTFSTSRTDTLTVGVDSGPAFRRLGWGLHYLAQKNRLGRANDLDSSTSTGNLRLMVTPQFYLTATGGYDKYDYVASPSSPTPSGTFYTGGFSWRPTERTSLASSIGRRFYGRTYSLDSSMRSRHSVWQISYNESVTTTPAEFALSTAESTSDLLNQLFRSSIPDDALRQQAVDRFILNTGLPATLTHAINYFSNQFFLQKSLRASVAVTGSKNTVVLSGFNTSRDPQSALDPAASFIGDPAANGRTRQVGANLLWNWKATALTSATFTADLSKTKLDTSGAETRLKTFRASLTRRFQPKLYGTVELRHVNQASDTTSNSYSENAATAMVSMMF